MTQIQIQDDGIGIAPDILEKIGTEGATFNKEGGFGVGLSHARTCVTQWHGELQVDSKLGEGVIVSLKIPLVDCPPWLPHEITLARGMKICVIDDDQSIFQAWQARLDEGELRSLTIELTYFPSLSEFAKRGLSPEITAHFGLYLVDYEFEKERNINTIQTLLDFGIESCSILVSNHSNDLSIQNSCLMHHLKLLPKDLIGNIRFALL